LSLKHRVNLLIQNTEATQDELGGKVSLDDPELKAIPTVKNWIPVNNVLRNSKK